MPFSICRLFVILGLKASCRFVVFCFVALSFGRFVVLSHCRLVVLWVSLFIYNCHL